MMKYLLFLISGLFLYSCKETEIDRISRLVKENECFSVERIETENNWRKECKLIK